MGCGAAIPREHDLRVDGKGSGHWIPLRWLVFIKLVSSLPPLCSQRYLDLITNTAYGQEIATITSQCRTRKGFHRAAVAWCTDRRQSDRSAMGKGVTRSGEVRGLIAELEGPCDRSKKRKCDGALQWQAESTTYDRWLLLKKIC